MAEEKKSPNEGRSHIDLSEENLFELKCLIKTSGLGQSARCGTDKKQFLAFTTSRTDIGLHYHDDMQNPAVVKRIPWFEAAQKSICALCFDPSGSWLLVASVDGSLYIVPALALMDPNSTVDHRWSTDNLTSFTSLNLQSSYSRPTSLAWWQGFTQCSHIGVIGTDRGEIVFVNLENGQQVGLTRVSCDVISSLHVCQDNSLEMVSLLITSESGQQWRLMLEQRATNYVYPLVDANTSVAPAFLPLKSSETIDDEMKTFPPARSRLQGLKQLSVEKLASLRQKLAETRSRNLTSNVKRQESGSSSSTDETNTPEHSGPNFDEKVNTFTPELLSNEMFLTPQYTKDGQCLYTGYNDVAHYVTIRGTDVSLIPSYVYKMPGPCRDILLVQRFFFAVSPNRRTLRIISCPLSEVRLGSEADFRKDSLVASIDLEDPTEMICSVYRSTDYKKTINDDSPRNLENVCSLPSKVEDIRVDMPPVDSCIVFTNFAIYKIVLRKSLLNVFMDFILKRNDLDRAARLGVVFGMKVQHLLEAAGDIFLMNNLCTKAAILYKLSKCHLLKKVLKFAAAGRTDQLLTWISHCLAPPSVCELTTATRIHLSNLTVLTLIELTLRSSPQDLATMRNTFLFFLSSNNYYDQMWAARMAGKTGLWTVLIFLATQCGLSVQVLDIIVKILQTMNTTYTCFMSSLSKYGLLMCMSEPRLAQALLANPPTGRSHIYFVFGSLCLLPIYTLQRVVKLYDPTNPVMRPLLVKCRARRRTTSQSSQSSQCDSLDSADVSEETTSLMEEIIETFLLALSTLVRKDTPLLRHNPELMRRIQLPEIEKRSRETTSNVDFKRRLLSVGFAHVALIRNGHVYTWGNATYGCLGTGPTISRYGAPQAILLFRNMEMEVLSVSCGRLHTLAVTNNGIYAWGSNRYGQLGLGPLAQCTSPELVTSLAHEIIIDATAGQYHSAALTIDGRVFTWGWGVHGQLGHGDTAPTDVPRLVNLLLGTVIRHVSAGHAHTLALSADGHVYAFGSNIFGQLGTGNTTKSSLPSKISLLPEKITHIATAYFHNLAVSQTNKLYTWGASPQVLRLQTQAQKKTRGIESQATGERSAESESSNTSESPCRDQPPSTSTDVDPLPRENDDDEVVISAIPNKIQRRLYEGRLVKSPSMKDLNDGTLEKPQAHLKPTLVLTDLVNGRIVQISTGCNHSALLTKDGTVYTWGRNLEGQIGNGTRREVLVPTPLDYYPAPVPAPDPPKSTNVKTENPENGKSSKPPEGQEKSSAQHKLQASTANRSARKGTMNRMIKIVRVCCGCDFTVAIQPGGTILAWGGNGMAQLGRPPTPKESANQEKLVMLKSTKRLIRIPHGAHVTHETPSQVPNIPTPIITYQSYDITPLAGRIRPLREVEGTFGATTLHYVLEQFHGLYDSGKLMDKFLEYGDYHACSKLAYLEHGYAKSFAYQLKTVNPASYKKPRGDDNENTPGRGTSKDSASTSGAEEGSSGDDNAMEKIRHLRHNEELFDKQIVKNLVETLEDCAMRKKLKMPVSRSLDSFQVLEQELHTFDCQGGSEELCEDTKSEDISLDITEDALDNDDDDVDEEESELNKNLQQMTDILIPKSKQVDLSLCDRCDDENVEVSSGLPTIEGARRKDDENTAGKNDNVRANAHYLTDSEVDDMLNDATRIIKFYMNEIDDTAHTTMRQLLHTTIEFWIEHDLPMHRLEKILLEHIDKLFYPLGLLLFCQNTEGDKANANENNAEIKSLRMMNSLSTKFCLQVCSMLLRHVDQGKPTMEYIELFSLLTAKNYGPPLTGYPGSSENKTAEQMMEGIISTLSSKSCDPRPFIQIKEPERVSRLFECDEDVVVFTCGHHFPLSAYKKEVIPSMEAELLMSQPVPLPCTAQLLENMLSRASKVETLCPMCIPRALQKAVSNLTDR